MLNGIDNKKIVQKQAKIIFSLVDSFLEQYGNDAFECSLEIIEKEIFIFVYQSNEKDKYRSKKKQIPLVKKCLNIDLDDLNELYLSLYHEYINKYLKSREKINIKDQEDINDEIRILSLIVKNNDDSVVVNLELKDFGYQKELLDSIKNNYKERVREEKLSKRR